MSIQIQFNRRHFSIDEATLMLLDFDSRTKSLIAPDGRRLEFGGQIPPAHAIEEFAANLDAPVVNGRANLPVGRPGLITGMMFGIRARRLFDGKTTLFAFAEFTHEVTEADCRSGISAVDIDTYKELIIRVQDSKGHPLADRTLSLLRFLREGCIDLTADKDGEVRLLLASGRYWTGTGRGKIVEFEVTDSDEEQVVTIVASDEPL